MLASGLTAGERETLVNRVTASEPQRFLPRRWPAALAAFEGATGEYRRIGARWYAAQYMREWVEAFLARGEPGNREQALFLLSQAAAEFDAMGAPFYAEQAKRRMNELAQP